MKCLRQQGQKIKQQQSKAKFLPERLTWASGSGELKLKKNIAVLLFSVLDYLTSLCKFNTIGKEFD